MHRVVILVTSDIIADQRVHRTANTLHENGFSVTVVGRRLKSSPKKICFEYKTVLLKLPFTKGPAFYAFYNLYAFFYLLFHRFSLIHANDLDTLVASRIASVIKRKPIIYDSHELFTEIPELISRPRTKRLWIYLEKRFIKGLKNCSTVSEGVANELKKRYNVNFTVIRNLPYSKQPIEKQGKQGEQTIIYQGALNIGRGLEKLIKAMPHLPNHRLIIVGTGPLANELKQLVQTYKLASRVVLYGRIEHKHLHQITCSANLGVSIEEDMGLNYRFALPNKIFDYIQAGIPVLASNLPEMARIIKTYSIGSTIDPNCNSLQLANAIQSMLTNTNKMKTWQANTRIAAATLCWEVEQEKLLALVENALRLRPS